MNFPNASKPTVLIVLSSNLFVRNFEQSGAFAELAETASCQIALSSQVDPQLLTSRLPIVGTVALSPERLKLCTFLMYLTMWAYRKRSSSFRTKFAEDVGPRKLQWLYKGLGLPGLRWLSAQVLLRLIGKNKSFEAILDKVSPDMVIFPSYGTELLAVEVIASCKSRDIPSFMLINGWDNLSTKGIMVEKPDYVGVWGKKAQEYATHIHHMHPDQVYQLGAPHFEGYRNGAHQGDIQKIRTLHAIPASKKVLLFAGCSRDVGEIHLLDLLEKGFANQRFKEFHVIYRPHPWGPAKQMRKLFIEKHYKHITLDSQMNDLLQGLERSGASSHPNSYIPSLKYYPALIASAECVISPLSTFLLEAVVMGKPALAVTFSVGPQYYSLEVGYAREHFAYLKAAQTILKSRKEDQFLDDVEKLISLSTAPNIEDLLNEDIKDVLFRDDKSYGERLLTAVAQICRKPDLKSPALLHNAS